MTRRQRAHKTRTTVGTEGKVHSQVRRTEKVAGKTTDTRVKEKNGRVGGKSTDTRVDEKSRRVGEKTTDTRMRGENGRVVGERTGGGSRGERKIGTGTSSDTRTVRERRGEGRTTGDGRGEERVGRDGGRIGDVGTGPGTVTGPTRRGGTRRAVRTVVEVETEISSKRNLVGRNRGRGLDSGQTPGPEKTTVETGKGEVRTVDRTRGERTKGFLSLFFLLVLFDRCLPLLTHTPTHPLANVLTGTRRLPVNTTNPLTPPTEVTPVVFSLSPNSTSLPYCSLSSGVPTLCWFVYGRFQHRQGKYLIRVWVLTGKDSTH